MEEWKDDYIWEDDRVVAASAVEYRVKTYQRRAKDATDKAERYAENARNARERARDYTKKAEYALKRVK